MMTEFKDRLNEGLALRRMSAAELARLSGVNEGAISQYRKGNYKANQYNLDKIAKALNVSIPWLMGADVPITPSIPNASNIFPIERKKIPLLGKIACGKPIMSEEIFDGYVGARIYDGDIVFIKQQPEVENGEIAAVSIDDAVTLKRVYFGDDYVELKPENPTYKPLRFNKTEVEQFRIIGKAIAFQGDII